MPPPLDALNSRKVQTNPSYWARTWLLVLLGADLLVILVEGANIAGIFIMIQYFFTVRHFSFLQTI